MIICGSYCNLFRLALSFDFALDLLEARWAARLSAWRSDGGFAGATHAPEAFLPDKCLYDFLSAGPLSALAATFVAESTLLAFEPLRLPNLLAAAFG